MKLTCVGTGKKEDDGTFTMKIAVGGLTSEALVEEVGEHVSDFLEKYLKDRFGGEFQQIYSAASSTSEVLQKMLVAVSSQMEIVNLMREEIGDHNLPPMSQKLQDMISSAVKTFQELTDEVDGIRSSTSDSPLTSGLNVFGSNPRKLDS